MSSRVCFSGLKKNCRQDWLLRVWMKCLQALRSPSTMPPCSDGKNKQKAGCPFSPSYCDSLAPGTRGLGSCSGPALAEWPPPAPCGVSGWTRSLPPTLDCSSVSQGTVNKSWMPSPFFRATKSEFLGGGVEIVILKSSQAEADHF